MSTRRDETSLATAHLLPCFRWPFQFVVIELCALWAPGRRTQRLDQNNCQMEFTWAIVVAVVVVVVVVVVVAVDVDPASTRRRQRFEMFSLSKGTVNSRLYLAHDDYQDADSRHWRSFITRKT